MKCNLRDWLAFPIAIKVDDVVMKTESPIEAMFVRTFMYLASIRRLDEGNPLGIVVFLQHSIPPYRVDLMLSRMTKSLIIECDGHEFHERTKEQATKDKTRDRFLVSSGYAVMRFTGSEIWDNPFIAASEALDFLMAEPS